MIELGQNYDLGEVKLAAKPKDLLHLLLCFYVTLPPHPHPFDKTLSSSFYQFATEICLKDCTFV